MGGKTCLMDASVPYIGYRISLLTNSEIRYEGTLSGADTNEGTVILSNVRSMGTEGRVPHREIPPSNEVYESVVFRGQNIKDITVCGNDSLTGIYQDPAIISAKPSENAILTNESSNKVKYEANTADGFNAQKPSSFWDNSYSYNDLNYNKPLKPAFEDSTGDPLENKQNTLGNERKEPRRRFQKKSPSAANRGVRGNVANKRQQQPQAPDAKAKETFNEEFDFELANAEFKKDQPTPSSTYLPSKFFDNISSDIQEVTGERVSQRKLDLDTFGEAAQNYRPRRFNNYHNRKGNQNNRRRNNQRESTNTN